MSSDTKAPASIADFAFLPSSDPAATAALNKSPVDTWGMLYFSDNTAPCVPLPEPGAPNKTVLIDCLFPIYRILI